MNRKTWDTPRCIFCHQTEGEMLELRVLEPKIWEKGSREVAVTVHPEHETETRRYYDQVHRFSRVFIFSILLGCAAPFVFLAFGWLPGIAASLLYLGIITWLFPLCTPTTVQMLGIRSSVRVARAFAALFILVGALLLAWL
jgi:hypothetical protein